MDARRFANVLGAALIAGFLGALAALFVIPIPKQNEQIIIYMIGQLSGFAGGIVAHHYSSKAHDAQAQTLDVSRAANLGKALDLAGETLAATPGGRPTGAPDDPVSVTER